MTVKITKPEINVREELNELKKPTGVAGEAMLRAETPQEQQALIGVGRRNIIINGDFAVSQRSAFSSAAPIASGVFCVDRWRANASFNIQRFTNSDVMGTNANYVRTSYSNNANMGLVQYIEDLNWKHLLGKDCTFSAYIRTNFDGSGLRYYDGQQNYGPRFVANGEWQKVTWSFNLRSSASILGFVFDAYNNGSYQNNAASGHYIDVALVQLELGKVATPFEHRSYGEELALCQRYFTQIKTGRIGGVINASGHGIVSHPVAFNMRAAPSASYSGTPPIYYMNGTSQLSSTVSGIGGSNGYVLNLHKANGNTGHGLSFWVDLSNANYFNFDAEL